METIQVPKQITPPGSPEHPYVRKVRYVDPRNNLSLIVGIPKQVAALAQIQEGSMLNVYYDPDLQAIILRK